MRLIPSCREMGERLSEARDSGRPLGPREWLHLLICAGCRRLRAQIRLLGDAASRAGETAGSLSDSAKARLRKLLGG